MPFDPDEGLEPRVDFAARLHESLDAAVRGAKTSPSGAGRQEAWAASGDVAGRGFSDNRNWR